MMATWLWMIFFLVFGTLMFLVGHYTGRIDSDKAPNPQVWQNVRARSIDANKEVAMYQIDKENEETMAMIERGCFDNVDSAENHETASELPEDDDGD